MAQKPYHHGNLEQALIEAGIKLLAEEGMQHFSLRKVASACGVSHTAPYKHFADKEALLEAMQRYMEDAFSKALQEALDAHPGDPDRMIYFAQAYLDFFTGNPYYLNLFIVLEQDGINLSALEEPSKYRPFEIFRSAALEEMEIWGVPKYMWERTLVGMWAMVHGITTMSVMRCVRYDGDWRQLLANVLKSTSHMNEVTDETSEC